MHTCRDTHIHVYLKASSVNCHYKQLNVKVTAYCTVWLWIFSTEKKKGLEWSSLLSVKVYFVAMFSLFLSRLPYSFHKFLHLLNFLSQCGIKICFLSHKTTTCFLVESCITVLLLNGLEVLFKSRNCRFYFFDFLPTKFCMKETALNIL